MSPTVGLQPVDIGMDYQSLVSPKTGNFSPNLVIVMDNSAFPLDFYTALISQWGYNSADRIVSMVYPGGNSDQTGASLHLAYHL